MQRFSAFDDEPLRRACVEGDPVAWEALLARYFRPVASVVRHILAKRGLPVREQDIEEVVDEFFGDLCATRRDSLGAFRGDGAFRAFLAVLAANHARRRAEADRRRRDRFGRPLESIMQGERFAAPDAGPDEAEEIALVLASLAEADRQLYRVLFVEEMDPEAAAERLGVTRTALYIRKCRFLKRVRERLDERSAEPASSPGSGKREYSEGHGTP